MGSLRVQLSHSVKHSSYQSMELSGQQIPSVTVTETRPQMQNLWVHKNKQIKNKFCNRIRPSLHYLLFGLGSAGASMGGGQWKSKMGADNRRGEWDWVEWGDSLGGKRETERRCWTCGWLWAAFVFPFQDLYSAEPLPSAHFIPGVSPGSFTQVAPKSSLILLYTK